MKTTLCTFIFVLLSTSYSGAQNHFPSIRNVQFLGTCGDGKETLLAPAGEMALVFQGTQGFLISMRVKEENGQRVDVLLEALPVKKILRDYDVFEVQSDKVAFSLKLRNGVNTLKNAQLTVMDGIEIFTLLCH